MEERLNQMNAVLQAMQQTLQCNICLDLLNSPLTTKCGHSFCAECIQQVVKGPRGSAQCPLCLTHITRRSLGQNNKITGLVVAVRKIIDSIKKDCCFEVTPSKYRPRPHPITTAEDDNSENEENDEPRRGTRKRGITNYYNPEVHVPKPRARSAKQRILTSHGCQELSLHTDGKSQTVGTEARINNCNEHIFVDVISKEHSYSSPTKQEPLVRSSLIPSLTRGKGTRGTGGGMLFRGRGRPAGNGTRGSSALNVGKSGKDNGKPSATYCGKKTMSSKTGADLLSVSQQAENTEFLPEEAINKTDDSSGNLSEKLGREKPADKVAKWLHNSSEVGFRIGASHSTDTTSTTDSESSQILNPSKRIALENHQCPTQALAADSTGCSASIKNVNSDKTSLSSSKKKESSIVSFTGSKKFFKSKDSKMSSESECQDPQEDAETQIFDPVDYINSTPSDPYNFIPSQKTPKDKTTPRRGRTVKTRGREALTMNRGRVRGRVRGRGIPVKQGEFERTNDSVVNTNLDFSLGIQTQSTPINKGTRFNKNVNLSVIKPPDIATGITQGNQLESLIVHAHDDDSDIPDSCPVTTKDKFDVLVSEVNEKMTSDSDHAPCLSVNQKAEEDKETALIFVTPAQAEEEPTKVHENKLKSKKGLKKRSNGESDCEREAKRKPKTKKENISDNDSTSSSSGTSQNVRNKRSKAEKAREEVEALCSMFDDIEDHHLSIMSVKEEEKNKQMKEKVKDNLMRQNISIMDQTFENTQHNKTVSPTITKDDNTMPPPKAPTGNKKVRFNADASVKHSGLCAPDEVAASASTKSSAKISPNNTIVFKGSHNVRYASKMKSKFIDTNKSVAVSVNVKCAKSPGWSHVEGARKDLKVRQTSLNITGGEHCNINDSRTEGGTCGYSLNTLTSSDETDVTIDEETQEFDIEHLASSQTKKDRVKKLKEIVSQLHKEEEKQRETKKQKVRLKRTNMSQPILFKESSENTKDSEMSHVLKSTGNIGHTFTDGPQHSRSQLLLPNDTESLHNDYKVSSHLSDKVNFTKSSQKSLTQSASSRNKMIGQKPIPPQEKDSIKEFNVSEKKVRCLSKLNRKTFSLTANTQDLDVLHSACESVEESPNVGLKIGSSPTEDSKKIPVELDNCREANRETSIFPASSSTAVSKPHPPHQTVSPSLTSDSSSKTSVLLISNTSEGNASIKTACISSQLSSEKNFTTHPQDGLRPQVVPFKSLGSLCSERCSKAADDASLVASFGGVGRDLCLHAVPCEVYQVLMKYMALMATQVEEHRTCCGNTQVSKRGQLTEPSESCAAGEKSASCGEKLKGNLEIQECQAETEKLVEPDISEKNKVKTVIQPPEGPNIVHSGEVEQESISEKKKIEIISISPEEPRLVHDREMVLEGCSSLEKENVNKSPEESNVVHDSEVVPSSYNTEDMKVALPLPNNIGVHTHITSAVCEQATGINHQSAERCQESSDNEKSTETHKIENKNNILNTDQSVTPKPYSQTSEILIEKCFVKSLIGPIESSSLSQMQDTQSSQLSTSLLALADVSENKTFLAYKNECPTENIVNVEGSSLEKNDRRVQSQKNKEKGVSIRTVVTDEELVEVEKENLESTNNFQPSVNRPRRKPLQSGQPVLENIMSQVNKDGKKPPIEKEELSWMQSQISQDSQKIMPSQNRPTNSKPLFSTDSSGEPKSPKGNLLITECSAIDSKSPEISDDDSPLKVSVDSSKRSFKRIRRPASSSSSSEDSDTEAMINPPKRKPKVISSSSSNPSSLVLEQTQKTKSESLKQHTLDSEEMRDLERLDQNVWEFFGHPDEDLMNKRDDDQNSHVSIDDVSSQNVKNTMEFDELPPVTLSLPSDDEIPGTAEVLKNVNADMAIIKKMRDEKVKDPEVITVTSSQELHSESIPTLSSSTKKLFTKVDKSLTRAESLLDHNTSFFENVNTPEEETKSIGELGIANNCMKPTKKSLSDKENQDADEKALEVIGASDQETEDEVDNASHSSAYSSQSEAISTQKQKQVKDEVAMLKARVRELEAAMKKKDATEVGKAQPEVDILPPTCPSVDSGDESEELFSSLPDLTESTEPKLLPRKDQTVTKESTPRCIRSIITGPPQLVCTGLNSSEMGKVQDLVKKWATPGSSVKRSWDKGITHVVVKTEPDRLAQRTLKYLFGVATGCWVITLQWVLDSLSTRKLLPEEDYEVLDCTGVTGPKRGRTSTVPLFSNCEFYIKPPFVDVTVEQLKELMELCGAQIVDSPVKFSQNKQSMKLVVVQTDSDHSAEEYKKVSVAHDWIIECIGMYAHICIAPYIVGSPNQSHLTASCLPQSLLEETQEL